MEELDTSNVDFSKTFASLVSKDSEIKKSQAKPETIEKKKVHPLPTDSSFGLMRLPQVLEHFPISRSAWLEGVKTGRYPASVQLSERCVAWRIADLKAFIESL